MPLIYRKVRRKPIPANATETIKRGVPGVAWVDGRGRSKWAPLDKSGKRIVVTDETYTIQYRDASGRRRERGTRTTSRAVAEEAAASLTIRIARERAGVHDEAAAQSAEHGKRSIFLHLVGGPGFPGYRDRLRDKGDSHAHVADTVAQIERVLKAAEIDSLNQLDSARIARTIARMKGARGGKLSAATRNSYIRACRAFSSWLYRRKRTREDALRDLETIPSEPTQTVRRRALTTAELQKIIAAADKAESIDIGVTRAGKPKRRRLPHRGMAYRIAAGTGFRAREIGSLTRDAFELDADPPTITVEAGSSKRRKRDVQPIAATLAHQIRAWLATMPRKGKLFRGWTRWGAAIKADAKAAGVAVKTTAGEIDFHGLRHTFATWVAASAPDTRTGMDLTRHSTPELYLKRYAKERAGAKAETVRALPNV